jgi:hypothetical protein
MYKLVFLSKDDGCIDSHWKDSLLVSICDLKGYVNTTKKCSLIMSNDKTVSHISLIGITSDEPLLKYKIENKELSGTLMRLIDYRLVSDNSEENIKQIYYFLLKLVNAL